jgi:hypothetical protein
MSARIFVVWGSAALLLAGTVAAAPSVSPTPAPATPAAAPPAPTLSVPAARGKIEGGMTELGTLLTRARQSGDGVRIACVQDKRDRAEIVLEVATGEILVLQDPAADGQSRAFAGEKLAEAADRLSGLVSQARACQGGPDDKAGAGTNEANQPKTVIPNDPTSAVPTGPRLPPRIDPRPPVASPVL